MRVLSRLKSSFLRAAFGSKGWSSSYGGAYRTPEATTDFALAEVRRLAGYVGGADRLRGISFLEIGPGMDLGIPLLLAGLGAEAYAIDRYPCPFDPRVHPEVYGLLRTRASREFAGFDPAPIDECLRSGAHRAARLHWFDCGLEDLRGVPEAGVHITYSNATFEHLADSAVAIAALHRVTAPGGVGFHQIDFRDHRDFARPLEYLSLDSAAFESLFRRVEGSCGNRLRGQQFEQLARTAGFEASLIGNMFADEAYLDGLMDRLDAGCSGWPRDWYRIISGRLVLRRAGSSRFALDVDGCGDPLVSRG